jgi:hypothetical protein
MSVPRSMHLSVFCWQAVPNKCAGDRRPSVRSKACIAFAGGALTNGGWGLEKDVLQVLRVLRARLTN